jgi:hypothetical protein
MSTNETFEENNEISEKPESVTDAHPKLGKYISHHPSNRLRLVVRALLLYALAVFMLEALFWNVDDNTASNFLPLLFAAVGLAAFWYAAHFWNREVILYENGFTYRQGSRLGQFRYVEIVRLQPDVSQLAILNMFQRTNFNYTLMTAEDEVLRITNLYSDIGKLIARLEGYIIRDRLALVQHAVNIGQAVDVGAGLCVSNTGLEYQGRELFWHEVGARSIKDGNLIVRTHDNQEWAAIPIAEVNNPMLLLTVLKQYAKQTTGG